MKPTAELRLGILSVLVKKLGEAEPFSRQLRDLRCPAQKSRRGTAAVGCDGPELYRGQCFRAGSKLGDCLITSIRRKPAVSGSALRPTLSIEHPLAPLSGQPAAEKIWVSSAPLRRERLVTAVNRDNIPTLSKAEGGWRQVQTAATCRGGDARTVEVRPGGRLLGAVAGFRWGGNSVSVGSWIPALGDRPASRRSVQIRTLVVVGWPADSHLHAGDIGAIGW